MSEARAQFTKFINSPESRDEPNYHSIRLRLMEALDKELPPIPEKNQLVDHNRKAEGVNALGLGDDFTGQMRELKIMLADIDQKIKDKTGKESKLSDTLPQSIYDEIRKQMTIED
jgi:hypothetical protein